MDLKKISTKIILFVCIISINIAIINNVYAFNPEESKVSKIQTIKTWLADQYQNNAHKIKKLQNYIAEMAPENPDSRNFQILIKNNEGDTRYFGKNFPTITEIELPFLRYVKEISQKKPVITLELAAGQGLISWKVPLCFENNGSKHYANELSDNMIPLIENNISQYLMDFPNTQNKLEIVPGNCFEILQSHEFLIGKVDALYVQNLEHFLNPATHQQFLDLIETLLAPGGRAFLCANTFSFSKDDNEGSPYNLFRTQQEMGDLYPGFMSYTQEFYEDCNRPGAFLDKKTVRMIEKAIYKQNTFVDERPEVTNAIRPADDAPLTKVTLDEPVMLFPPLPLGGHTCQLIRYTQQNTINAFTPSIYQKLIESRPNLTYRTSFLLNNLGQKISSNDVHSWVAVIFEKKNPNNNNNNNNCNNKKKKKKKK